MRDSGLIQPADATDRHFAQPAFGRLDANEAISDRALRHFGTANFLTAEELLKIPDLSQPDPKGTGFSDLAGEVPGTGLRQPSAPLFLNGPGLTLTFGAPGSGKSTQISTNLLRPRRDSFIVLDLKGELHTRCAPWLSRFMDVQVHPLFFGSGATFNPLTAIAAVLPGASHRSEAAIRAQTELENLARDMVQQTLDQPFWVNAERSLFQTLAGHVISAQLAEPAKDQPGDPWRVRARTVAEVRRLATLSCEDRKRLVVDGLMQSRMPYVRDGAHEWRALMMARETYAAVHTDLLEQLKPWAHPVIEHASRDCSYSFDDLRRRPTAVFLQVPPAQIRLCKSWLRAYFGTAMRQLMYDTGGHAVSFYLDEAALLGTMESFDEVIGAIRGYRIRLNAFYQSLGQLKAGYPKTWETWLSTAFAKVYFGINDVDTAEWISRSVGDTTIAVPSFQVGCSQAESSGSTHSRSEGQNTYTNTTEAVGRSTPERDTDAGSVGTTNFAANSGGGRSSHVNESSSHSSTTTSSDGTHWSYGKRRLIDATEVMTLPDGMQIVQTPRGPILARMARYFENPDLLARAADSAGATLPSPSFSVGNGERAEPE